MTPTESKLIDVLTKGLKLKRPAPITPQTLIFGKPTAGETLGLDSVDVLEVAVLMDKHFGVELEDQGEAVHQALTSIQTLAAYIDARSPKV
ncbi:MAG TPA: phosphopantetheine-binding protein [Phycisphaerae bacterium]|jgi:acyl carrier protein